MGGYDEALSSRDWGAMVSARLGKSLRKQISRAAVYRTQALFLPGEYTMDSTYRGLRRKTRNGAGSGR